MENTFDNQTLYIVQDFSADSVEISLYNVLPCENEWFSIVPDELRNNKEVCFTLNVTEQKLFSFTEISLPEKGFLTTSAEIVCRKQSFIACAMKRTAKKLRRRCNCSSHCALYKAVARIRL